MLNAVDQKIELFFGKYKSHKYKKNHILVHAQQEPSAIFNLVSGQVRQYDISDQGDKVVVNVFKPPAFFIMSWAINKTPNQYYLETATEVIVRKAPPDEVIEFLKNNNDVLFDLLSRVFLGTDVILRRMAHLMGGNAHSRLIYELILEANSFGETQKDGSIFIPLHLNELAARSGLSRETASREIGKIKDLGISVNRKGIIIKSIKELEQKLGNNL